MKETRDENYIGKTFNYWTVLDNAPDRCLGGKIREYLLCECRCGTIREVLKYAVVNGESKSCGCRAEVLKKEKRKKKIQEKINNPSFWKYQVGELLTNNRCTIKITKQIYNGGEYDIYKKQHGKYYAYDCLTCGYSSDDKHMISENNLTKGKGCPCCGDSHLVVKGVNDIATTRPDIANYFTNIDDTFKYSYGSGQKVDMTCPRCLQSDKYVIDTVTTHGFNCHFCSDGLSYPEKFIRNVLIQCGEEFVTQLSKTTFKWCEDYRYDIYLPNKNTIIEVHGSQHYIEFKSYYGTTLEDRIKIDNDKYILAKNNGIENYITIDCRYSELEWIKENVQKSLSEIIDLSNIDYNLCHEYATNSMIVDVCNYYMENDRPSVTDISKTYGYNRTTIRKYLKVGAELGICDYSTEEALKAGRKRNSNAKPLEAWKDGQYMGKFSYTSDLINFVLNTYNIKLDNSSVWRVCNGKLKSTKGFICKYVEN